MIFVLTLWLNLSGIASGHTDNKKEQAALEHLKHCLKQDEQEANIDQQLSLFEKLKKSMQ